MYGDPKAAYYVLPYEMMYLVSGDLGDKLGFNPLGEVLDGHHK